MNMEQLSANLTQPYLCSCAYVYFKQSPIASVAPLLTRGQCSKMRKGSGMEHLVYQTWSPEVLDKKHPVPRLRNLSPTPEPRLLFFCRRELDHCTFGAGDTSVVRQERSGAVLPIDFFFVFYVASSSVHLCAVLLKIKVSTRHDILQ